MTPTEDLVDVTNQAHYILCQLADTTYGLPSHIVQHVELVPPITRLPNAAPYVEGVAMVRGQAIPAVSLRLRLGLPWQPHDLRSRLVVVRSGERMVGLLADSAREFVQLPAAAVQPPPEAGEDHSSAYLAGVALLGDRLVLILRIEAILGDVALSAHADATV